MAEKWLSIVEYARAYAISDMTVRRRIKTGRLQAVLREGKYYIPADSRAVPEDLPEPIRHSSPSFESLERSERVATTVSPRQVEVQPRSARDMNVHARPQSQTHFSAPLPETRGDYAPIDQYRPRPPMVSRQDFDGLRHDIREALAAFRRSGEDYRGFEKKLEDQFSSRYQTMQMELKIKEGEIQRLQQQLEDMILLVSVLEKNSAEPRA